MKSRFLGHRVGLRALSVFVLLFAAVAVGSWPQEAPEAGPAGRPVYWWLGISPGAGFISGGATEGLLLGCLDLTVQRGKLFVSLRGTAGANPSDDRTTVTEAGVMAGYFHRKLKSAWSAGAGIGYVDMYPPSKPPFKGLSFPLEVRYSWFLSRFVGLTASGLLNINGGASYAGVTVGVQLGRIRQRGV